MEKIASTVCKLSHKQFRALLKKFRRKKIRQKLAKEREALENLEQQKKESAPNYQEIQEEIRRNSQLYDEFEERERLRQHKLWLLREEHAQQEFRRKQKQIELDKARREEERKRILEEFEKQEYVDKQAEEEIKKTKSQKEVITHEQFCNFLELISKYEALQKALSNLSEADEPWHNPFPPENNNATPHNYNAGQEREQCMFFSKTGCCRFGDRCSRGHTRPDLSSTILIRGMYSHFSIDQTARDDYDTDIALEYEDKECYQDFKNFYRDVLPEFKKFGKVVQFKVCNNFEPHLRGNVYVQYARENEAVEAYKNFNGRYYASRQITCEFTHVIRWRSAICGLHSRNLCPKGMNCNFLHVFKNPNDEFWEADRDLVPRDKHGSNSSRKRENSRDDHSRNLSSEHRYKSSRHEARSDRYESFSERHESRSDRHESRSDRHESRSDRHESRSDRYESRRDKYEHRSERHESYEKLKSRKDRSDRYESENYKDYDYDKSVHESRTNKHGDKYDHLAASESGSESCDEIKASSEIKVSVKKNKSYSSSQKHSRDSSSSRSESPEDPDQRKKNHKRKKHKKKSKKSRKKEYSDASE